MAERSTIIDPDGDILVILSDPSSISDAVIEPEPVRPEPAEPEATITEPGNDEEAQPEPSEAPAPEEWQFKASSKHLALASTRFKKMMDGPWREANEIHDDGLRHWVIEEFNLDAMAIVLHIIHGKNRQVLQTITLKMLVEVARIVDYAECHEAMEVYSSIWIRDLKKTIPESYAPYPDELLYWICVAGVFHKDKIFESCTRLAILESHIDIPTFGLPILPVIGDKIVERRVHHLDRIFASVYSLLDHLSNNTKCSFECDAMLLGTLTKSMHANLFNPHPTKPYKSLSVTRAVKVVNNLSVPGWCSKVTVASEGNGNTVRKKGKVMNKQQKMIEKRAKRFLMAGSWPEKPQVVLEELEELEEPMELEVLEHKCGFDELIATVNRLESEIKGFRLEDLGMVQVKR
ncbi:hypothetical protein HD806DRAFT_125188 [Xylariaceae sp. AK1471]|nr:hypothetical protein HD806DRAFT_125188 [Xylariaceae sp. AK1471]